MTNQYHWKPLWSIIFSGLALFACNPSLAHPKITTLAKIQFKGKILNAIVAPGQRGKSQWIYASYANLGGSFDLVAINPTSGKSVTFHSPLTDVPSAWALASTADGQVFIGTEFGHIMKLDWGRHSITNLCSPDPRIFQIWQMVAASDGMIYGVASPRSELIRFNPRKKSCTLIKQLSTTNKYARFIQEGKDGLLYISLGDTRPKILSYNIFTKKIHTIISSSSTTRTFPLIVKVNNIIYANPGNRWYKLDGIKAIPSNRIPAQHQITLQNSATINYSADQIWIKSKNRGKIALATSYSGGPQEIFNMRVNHSDHNIYASTTMPTHFFKININTGNLKNIGILGEGEVYSSVFWKGLMIGAAYAAQSPIFIYNPNRPWNPGATTNSNPEFLSYKGENTTWRPRAMTLFDQKVYIGSEPGYGRLGGSLVIVNPVTKSVTSYRDLIKNQSIASLTALNKDLLIGGTSIYGGSGASPSTEGAQIFIWNNKNSKIAYQSGPIKGVAIIKSLHISKNDLVYGLSNHSMIIFDPKTHAVKIRDYSEGKIFNNSRIIRSPTGGLYIVSNSGLFRINIKDNKLIPIASFPQNHSHAFTHYKNMVFFQRKDKVISFTLKQN